jgi:chromosome segregation ATPase
VADLLTTYLPRADDLENPSVVDAMSIAARERTMYCARKYAALHRISECETHLQAAKSKVRECEETLQKLQEEVVISEENLGRIEGGIEELHRMEELQRMEKLQRMEELQRMETKHHHASGSFADSDSILGDSTHHRDPGRLAVGK